MKVYGRISIYKHLEGRLLGRYVGLLFALPCILIIAIVFFYPMYRVFILSFSKFEITSLTIHFTGINNYLNVFKSSYFWQTMRNSLIWTSGSTFFQFLLGFSAALILNQKFIGRIIFRAFIILPWTVSGVVLAYAWKWLYDSDYGMINGILSWLGLQSWSTSWLGEPRIALSAVLVANVWWIYPFAMLIMLAGLQGIPEELYSAAKIDGAGAWQLFRYITVPMLKNAIVVVTLLLAIWSLNSFTLIHIMTRGGPVRSSEIFANYIYREAFTYYNFEMASAASIVLVIFGLVFIASYLRLTKSQI